MSDCDFCFSYESNKNVQEFMKNRPDLYGNVLHDYEINCAMVTRTWIKGQPKRNGGRTTDYRYRGIGYKLNYCPECGKKLKDTP